MTKKGRTKGARKESPQPLRVDLKTAAAVVAMFEHALDVAAILARGDADDRAAVSRLRRFLHDAMTCDDDEFRELIAPELADVLTVAGMLFAAIDIDPHPPEPPPPPIAAPPPRRAPPVRMIRAVANPFTGATYVRRVA